jgi:hypothetical protein
MAQKPIIPKSRKTVERAKKQAAKGSVKEVKKAVDARGSTLGNIDGSVASLQEWSDKLDRYGPRTLRRRSVQVAPI